MKTISLFTIGFTQKSAETFFGLLIDAGVKRLVDVRLNNTSQLAGFAKKTDLIYFLRELGGIDYIHLPQLAPTKDIFDAYKKQKGDWKDFREGFLALMARREVEKSVSPEMLAQGCLLCSESDPTHCHRSLIVEYLGKIWGNLDIQHLT
jgi:uncharacterized protein (DUF488 family)